HTSRRPASVKGIPALVLHKTDYPETTPKIPKNHPKTVSVASARIASSFSRFLYSGIPFTGRLPPRRARDDVRRSHQRESSRHPYRTSPSTYLLPYKRRTTWRSIRRYRPILLKITAGAFSFEAANPRHQHEYHSWERVRLPEGKVLIPS